MILSLERLMCSHTFFFFRIYDSQFIPCMACGLNSMKVIFRVQHNWIVPNSESTPCYVDWNYIDSCRLYEYGLNTIVPYVSARLFPIKYSNISCNFICFFNRPMHLCGRINVVGNENKNSYNDLATYFSLIGFRLNWCGTLGANPAIFLLNKISSNLLSIHFFCRFIVFGGIFYCGTCALCETSPTHHIQVPILHEASLI